MAEVRTTVEVVSDLMTTDIITTSSGDTVTAARRILLGAGLHALPVIDASGTTIGLVTLMDLDSAGTATEAVDFVMSQPVVTIDAGSAISAAADLMIDKGIHHLVVTEGQATIGLVSSLDLLQAVASPRP